MHNLYGHSMAKAVHSYWDEMEMRPMSLLRSTFPGSGQYG
jgi:alpha-glucosidase (family GH31 glycosyl hydrolase)